MLHKYLDEQMDYLEWGGGPWTESSVGWNYSESSGDLRLKLGRGE